MVVRRPLPALLLSAVALCAGGCAEREAYVTQDALAELTTRVADLERDNGRLRVQLRDAEEHLFLLEDRVESARIAAASRPNARMDDARVRFGRQATSVTPSTQSAAPFRAPVTSGGAPPRPDIDPLARPSHLPVVSVGPNAPAPAAPSADAGSDETVIDMSLYVERFGDEPSLPQPARASTSSRPASTASSSAGSVAAAAPASERRPQPPVDTQGMRLPSRADDENRALAPADDASGDGLTSRQVYQSALDAFNAADYSASLASLHRFVEMGPDPDYMDNALFWMGECHYGLGQYDQAITHFQRVVSEFPNGNKVPDSLLKVALTHERMSQPEEAIEALRLVVDTYPTTHAAERAAERLRALQ